MGVLNNNSFLGVPKDITRGEGAPVYVMKFTANANAGSIGAGGSSLLYWSTYETPYYVPQVNDTTGGYGLVAPVAGYYRVSVMSRVITSGATNGELAIYRNPKEAILTNATTGTQVAAGRIDVSATTALTLTVIDDYFYLNAGEKVSCYLICVSGTLQVEVSASTKGKFTLTLVQKAEKPAKTF